VAGAFGKNLHHLTQPEIRIQALPDAPHLRHFGAGSKDICNEGDPTRTEMWFRIGTGGDVEQTAPDRCSMGAD